MRPPSFPDELAFWNTMIPIDRSDIFHLPNPPLATALPIKSMGSLEMSCFRKRAGLERILRAGGHSCCLGVWHPFLWFQRCRILPIRTCVLRTQQSGTLCPPTIDLVLAIQDPESDRGWLDQTITHGIHDA